MLTENYIRQESQSKLWDFGQYNGKLKGTYKNEHASEVKSIKLSKKELDEYLKKFK